MATKERSETVEKTETKESTRSGPLPENDKVQSDQKTTERTEKTVEHLEQK